MLVKATRLLYYNDRRQKEGSVFKLVDKKRFEIVEKKNKDGKVEKVKKWIPIPAEAQFTPSCMEKVEAGEVEQEVVEHAESFAEKSSEDVL